MVRENHTNNFYEVQFQVRKDKVFNRTKGFNVVLWDLYLRPLTDDFEQHYKVSYNLFVYLIKVVLFYVLNFWHTHFFLRTIESEAVYLNHKQKHLI